jgi:hypothetical protein
MVENVSRDPPQEVAKSDRAQLIPDPWDIPSDSSERVQMPEDWQLPAEPHPLIKAAGSPEAPKLPVPTLEAQQSIVQILLQGELKLKAGDRGLLANQIETALALLGWMGMVKHLSATG